MGCTICREVRKESSAETISTSSKIHRIGLTLTRAFRTALIGRESRRMVPSSQSSA